MLTLRELQRHDLAILNTWRNDPELILSLGTNFLYIAPEIDERWYDNYLSQRDRFVRLAIVENASNEFIGCVNLTNLHLINRSAEFSIMIGAKKHQGKGYGMIASKAILRHGFMNLNLNRIFLYVLSFNTPAIRLYKKIGFKSEGVLRQAIYKDGTFHDEMVMSILRAEFIKEN